MSGFSRRLLQAALDPEIADPDFGTPANRTPVFSKPDDTNTGPRSSTIQTYTGPEAVAAVLAAPVEADGKRYLRRALITSGMSFGLAVHSDIIFEDCIVDGNWGLYTISGWYNYANSTDPTGDYPEFRYCEIKNANSACLIGQHMRFLRCNIHHGNDISKPFGDIELYANYMHSNWHQAGAHCDIIQIVSGAAGFVAHWNNFMSFFSSDSPDSPGQQGNGVTQTGNVSGDIGPCAFDHNWCDGGNYTLRGPAERDSEFVVIYTFTNNRLGRNYSFGPLTGIPNSAYSWSVTFDSTNVWDDTGQPVL